LDHRDDICNDPNDIDEYKDILMVYCGVEGTDIDYVLDNMAFLTEDTTSEGCDFFSYFYLLLIMYDFI
jgi:hypothetical protein